MISGVVVLMATSAVLAKDDALPKIDLEKQCRKTQVAADSLTGQKNPDAFDLCLRNEQSAREKLMERWGTIPAADKRSCIHSTDWSPSYFEWLGCIDTKVYVRTMRENNPFSMSSSKLCPTVTWQTNGSVSNVVACQLR